MYNVLTGKYEDPVTILYGYVDGEEDNPMILKKDEEENGVYLTTEFIQNLDQAENLIVALQKAIELKWWKDGD